MLTGQLVVTDTPFPIRFTPEDIDLQERKVLYKGFFALEQLTLKHRLFGGGWSRTIHREVFMRGAAVGVVLYDPWHDSIGVLQQFRVGAYMANNPPWCMEIVAGIVEPGEALDEVAHREIEEETGLQVTQLEYICQYLVSPGGTDETMDLFCGLVDLSAAGGVHGLPSEGEDILIEVFEAETVFANLYQGRFNNAPSLIALQWLQLNRERLRRQIEAESTNPSS